MKKLLLSAMLLLATYGVVQSQVLIAILFGDKLNSEKLEFGLDLGANITKVTGLDGAKYRSGVGVGLYFNYKFHKNWMFHPSVFVKSPHGARDLDPYPVGDPSLDSVLANTRILRDLSYINLPLTIRYESNFGVGLELGPVISLLRKAKDRFQQEDSFEEGDEIDYQRDIRDNYKRIDMGMSSGVFYRLGKQKEGVTINFRFNYGFMDILKNNTGDAQRNMAFQVFAGIPVRGKQKGEGTTGESDKKKDKKANKSSKKAKDS